MAVIDIFSKRQKRLRGEVPDTYRYDEIPHALRVQIVQIIEEMTEHLQMGPRHWGQDKAYGEIAKCLRREYGVFRLAAERYASDQEDVLQFVLSEDCVERVLDAVEVSFLWFLSVTEGSWVRKNVDGGIGELNARFGEHGVGFQLSAGRIVRMDSQYVHAEVVKPALRLLNGRRYSGAQDEFLKAHAHFRRGETKDVLSECLKALESVMKSICIRRKWKVSSQATVGKLIDVCFQNGLVPAYWKSHFSGLRSVLESGVPTARNRQGGHGQGPVPTVVPKPIAAFVLHQTAAAIVFLVEAEAALP